MCRVLFPLFLSPPTPLLPLQKGPLGQSQLNIFLSDPDVLNAIAWSNKLDKTFKENVEKYPGIYWQSFGSQEGILRM